MANVYLYTHPLFTCTLLVLIGVVFGVCITLLSLEIFYVLFILHILAYS